MQRFLLIFLLLFIVNSLQAQGEVNNWYFGQNAGITFNNGAPVGLLDSAMDTVEGCSTISDASGNLLFYSNGNTVWNRNHTVMPNGSGLTGHPSSTQNGLIIPHPGNSNLFYVFSLHTEPSVAGLYYSIVDMTMNNGLGGISVKNVFLYGPTTEKITATVHANGNDVWVVTHKDRNGSNEFYSYLIDNSGINVTPVITSIGHMVFTDYDRIGQMKISPDGTKLAIAYIESGLVELYRFNSNTGQVFDRIEISNLNTRPYGIEFSPNNRFLYVSSSQYDISIFNQTDVALSRVLIQDFAHRSLQLGPDGKIYAAVYGSDYIGVIHCPNLIGNAVDFQLEGVFLPVGNSRRGLPSFITSYFFSPIIVYNTCLGDLTTFELISDQPVDSVIWDFGDGNSSTIHNPSNNYTMTGTYNVTATITSGTDVYSVTETVVIHESLVATAPQNILICDTDSIDDGFFQFDLTINDSAILNGQSPSVLEVTYYASMADYDNDFPIVDPRSFVNTIAYGTETIVARVHNINNRKCKEITTFDITVYESPVLSTDQEWMICDGGTVEIFADPGFDTYLWSTGESTESIIVSSPGDYTVTISRDHGVIVCDRTKDIRVVTASTAVITNIEIKDWSQDNNSVFIEVEGIGDYEYSLDGITYQDSNRFDDLILGDYQVYVRDRIGCETVIVQDVFLLFYPRFFTPNGDHHHDFWQLHNSSREPLNKIYIYDRYGKLLSEISPTDLGWDGTYNGDPLPSSDYWFVVERSNGKIHKGHFTLKR